MDPNNPQNQAPFNTKTPISEVLKQEKEGFTPSALPIPKTENSQKGPPPTLGDVVGAMAMGATRTESFDHQTRIIKTYKTDAEEAIRLQGGGQKMPNIPQPMQAAPVVRVAPVAPVERATSFVQPISLVPETPTAQVASIAPVTPIMRVITNEPRMATPVEPERMIVYEREDALKPKKKIFVPVLVVVILLVLGGASIPAVQYFLNQKKAVVPIAKERTIIPFDLKETITLEKTSHDDLANALAKLPTNTASVKYVEIFQKILDSNQKTITSKVPTNTFAAILGENMPSSLERSFDGDYMYAVADIKHPRAFILLKTSSYDQTFAGMLKWEIKMVSDLTPILNISEKITGQPFTDKIITSKDVRAVVSPLGETYFLYGFIDNQTLLITIDTRTFQDISSRYIASRFVQ